jgi:fructokinase
VQVERGEFKTTSDPSVVLSAVVEWLKTRQYDSIGIASFGPIELHEDSPKYGFITTTPKPGWRDTDVVGFIRKGLNLSPDFPVGFDTDVNAPAMAEYLQALDNGEKLTSCAYVTVGTGIGVGFVFNGNMLHGLLHGEGGHIAVPPFPGPVSEEILEKISPLPLLAMFCSNTEFISMQCFSLSLFFF